MTKIIRPGKKNPWPFFQWILVYTVNYATYMNIPYWNPES